MRERPKIGLALSSGAARGLAHKIYCQGCKKRFASLDDGFAGLALIGLCSSLTAASVTIYNWCLKSKTE